MGADHFDMAKSCMRNRFQDPIEVTEFTKRVELDRQDIRVPHGSSSFSFTSARRRSWQCGRRARFHTLFLGCVDHRSVGPPTPLLDNPTPSISTLCVDRGA
jgi:hypothetical protein